jgi:methylmalonyl-CoA mutase N-terminal domain/subunit
MALAQSGGGAEVQGAAKLIEAVEAYATVGEISDRLRVAFGVHRELITI